MPKRKREIKYPRKIKYRREVRYRADAESTSPGTLGDADQEDQTSEPTTEPGDDQVQAADGQADDGQGQAADGQADDEQGQAADGQADDEQGQAADGQAADEPGDEQDQRDDDTEDPVEDPSPSGGDPEYWQHAWADYENPEPPAGNPNPHWYTGQGSAPVILPPRPTTFYPATQPQGLQQWSYEVEGPDDIYRISTMPRDFFGVQSEWPPQLVAGYRVYKTTASALAAAEGECRRASNTNPPTSDARRYELEETRYQATITSASARADFMREWPSAFVHTDNHKGHADYVEHLVGNVHQAQRFGLQHFEA